MSNIKNIIFDFGGVLYDIDVPLAIESFKKLGISKDIWTSNQDNLFNQIETGKIQIDILLEHLQTITKPNTSKEDLLEAFHSVLVGMPHYTIDNLRKIKGQYPLYLLSNTNHAHFDKFEKEILEDPYTKNFFNFFEKEFYSFKMGLRKPDTEIYKRVLNESGIKANETLFVDDNQDNLKSAGNIGIQTFWFENKNSWADLFKLLKL
jgi:FMN phosphatase YigB (HAD superfamily)